MPRSDADSSAAEQKDAEASANRSEHLRQKAHELFATKGLDVPLADIAKAAGVGVATLYRQYRNKDVLILEVYRERLAYARKYSVEANEHPNAWDGLIFFLTRDAEQFMSDRGMRELVLGAYVGALGWSRGSSHKELIEALDAFQRQIGMQLKALVARAKAQKVVREDFEAMDVLLMSAMASAATAVNESGWPVSGQRALQLLIEGIRPS